MCSASRHSLKPFHCSSFATMGSNPIYDVVVVGGGPVGLASAYQVAKEGKSVIVLEQRNFFNQAGSSGDMARMFRTM